MSARTSARVPFSRVAPPSWISAPVNVLVDVLVVPVEVPVEVRGARLAVEWVAIVPLLVRELVERRGMIVGNVR